jgi:hypothetical protein
MKLETSAMDGLPTLRWRSHTITTAGAGAAITLQRPSAAVAVTTAGFGDEPNITLNAHELQAGDWITLSGANKADFNGTFAVVAVDDANNFSIHVEGAEDLGDPTNPTLTFRCMAQRADIHNVAANAQTMAIGGNDLADFYPVAAGSVYTLEAPRGAKFDLADVYAKFVGAAKSIKVLYI